MSWLIIVVVAYFLIAIASVIDKYLISKRLPQPVVYTFFIGLSSGMVLLLIPFGLLKFPSLFIIFLSFISGASYVFALFYFFSALKNNEATKIMPYVGGFQPIFILVLSYFFLNERLNNNQLIAFGFLVIGTILITSHFNPVKTLREKCFLNAFIATVLFSLSYFLTKFVYNLHPFFSAFIWIRMGSFLAVLSFLIFKENQRKIFNTLKAREGKRNSTGFIFIFGQTCGAFGFFLVNYAIKLGSVSLTNAFQGLQYFFLLIIVLILSKKFPKIIKEDFSHKILIQKIAAIVFIVLSLLFLSL
ncbi:MAG: Uncharacterized protein Athens101410_263 [Parcubacteria group bacterium Athens1014_10]|nr:MAG: Uncharacterized protein Athens101410_263 [Parcubacteria group bacterium Athens1014_10]TSD04998.1 MAG: Uncharacterized protein Athens071412_540 [Parcubacteria group bacterium Athens0714_12]